MLLGTLGVSLLGNILADKGTGEDRRINRASEGIIRAGYARRSSKNKKMDF